MQGLFRLQDNTPTAYTEDSRDFQLMLRLYDCVNNGVKYYIDSIIDSLNTGLCSSELLVLLKTKIGFFSNVEFTDREARFILKSFPYIMKYKGSEEGIKRAVRVFMAAEGISASNNIFIDSEKHEIEIFIESSLVSTKMLEEMLRYIIPTGYIVSITFGNPSETSSEYQEDQFGMSLEMPDLYGSVVRGSVAPNIDTDGVSPDNSVYYGFRAVETPLSPTMAKYAYEISGTIVLSDGDLSGAVFTASDNSPQLYDQTNSNYYRVEGGKWVNKGSSVDSSRSYILVSGATISTATSTDDTLSTTVLGSNTQNICLYTETSAWTNMEYNSLGNVGFTDVLGSTNADGGTPASYTF